MSVRCERMAVRRADVSILELEWTEEKEVQTSSSLEDRFLNGSSSCLGMGSWIRMLCRLERRSCHCWSR